MKETYLETLEEVLTKANVENVKEVVKIYEDRFELGALAGMSEEEIIARFDSMNEIVAKCKKKETKVSENNLLKVSVSLSLEHFDDFDIVLSPESGIRFDLEKGSEKYVTVEKNGDTIELKSISGKSIFKTGSYKGTMYVGSDTSIEKFMIKNFSGDVNICDIEASSANIANISGDINFDVLKLSESCIIKNSSGDINFEELDSNKIVISNVSGDIDIDNLQAEGVKISTVSGDVVVCKCNTSAIFTINTVSGDILLKNGAIRENVTSSSVSGDVVISGESQGSDIVSAIKEKISKIKIK